MYCIIPLAGPDCYDPISGIRCLQLIDGVPLIHYIVTSRPWYASGELKNEHLLFVLRAGELLPELKYFLENSFPGCRFVILSHLTKGALLSAGSALSLIEDFERPIMVDLADISYHTTFSPMKLFQGDQNVVGIVPYFYADHEKYSYLRMEGDCVLETAEKRVISNQASSGTYCFRNFSIFCKAMAGSAENMDRLAYRQALFVCPSFNCLIPHGKVLGVEVNSLKSCPDF